MKKRQWIGLALAASVMVGCTACSDGTVEGAGGEESSQEEESAVIGVSMPAAAQADASFLKQRLEEEGYRVDLQYADSSEDAQQGSQVESMVAGGCDVLVISPDQGADLTSPLEEAKQKNIPVISYGGLISNSDAVSYYVTQDSYTTGSRQGEYIRDTLDLDNQEGPFFVEFVAGSLQDRDAFLFFSGAVDILQPYMDAGKLKVLSGQTEMEQCATETGTSEEAQARMKTLISSHDYGPDKTQLDAVLCLNDTVSLGVQNALKEAGYTQENRPLVTGMGCEAENVRSIAAGMQDMSVLDSAHTMVSRVVAMIQSLLAGEEPEVNDTQSYDNGSGAVPAYVCDPVVVTRENYEEILIDGGYYTQEELA